MKRTKQSRPRYNLEPCTNDKGNANIYLVYRYNRADSGYQNRLKYSIREKVKVLDWIGSPTYRANPNYEIYEELNEKLGLIYNAALKVTKERPEIPPQDFKDELDYLLGYKRKPKTTAEMSFIEYFKDFIRHSENHDRTIQKYNGVYNHLVKYTTEKKIDPSFDDITGDFAKEFRNWIYKKYKSSANTTAKHSTVIKQVMRDAELKGLHTNLKYKLIESKRTKTSKHYLTLSELDKISKHVFDNDEDQKLEKVRDIFLIACYTGLRYSDFSVLKKENIIESEGIKMIDIEQYKGRAQRDDSQILIPILPDLDKILTKYNYEVPKAYTSQKMNAFIKEILEDAKINRIVKHYSSVAGKQTESNVPVWSKTTNHTARYTFIDIMLNEYNIHPTHLAKITGQTLDVLLGYERGAKDRNAKKVYNQVIEKIKSSKLKAV
jgi:hypothetical protein